MIFAGALPQNTLGELTALPRPPIAVFKGPTPNLRDRREWRGITEGEGKGKESRGKGREGGRKGRETGPVKSVKARARKVVRPPLVL